MGAFDPEGTGGAPNPNPTNTDLEASGDATPPAGNEETPAETNPAVTTGKEDAGADDPFANFSIEEPTEFGPTSLAAALEADPAALAAIEANPELKGKLFANARKAERAQKYDELLGSPDEARVVVEGNNAYMGISGLLEGVQDGNYDSVNAVVNAMLQQTVVRDDEGNPVKDQQGNVRTNGTVGRFLKNWFLQRMESNSQKAATANDEEYQLAIDVIMEREGLRARSSADEGEESEALRTERETIRAEREALDNERRQQQEADAAASDTRVNSEVDRRLDGALQSILNQATGLDKFARGKVETDIRKELRTIIKNSNAYRAERRNIEARPLGSGREKALIELAQRYIQTYLPKAARRHLAEAGVSIEQRTKQNQSQQAAREAAARSETRTSLPPARTQTNTNSVQAIETELTAKLGRTPTTQEILAERMNRANATAAR